YSNKLYTSMIGYFPATNPKVALYVIVDSPSGEGIWGSTVAAPVFKEIATELVRILNLTPDKQKAKK
ncbi:peptidoglycan glycosyltransferase FtsI, partial [bacterium]|nr:peptidoglycan glycosyltransferase FtsI [bacterium]